MDAKTLQPEVDELYQANAELSAAKSDRRRAEIALDAADQALNKALTRVRQAEQMLSGRVMLASREDRVAQKEAGVSK